MNKVHYIELLLSKPKYLFANIHSIYTFMNGVSSPYPKIIFNFNNDINKTHNHFEARDIVLASEAGLV